MSLKTRIERLEAAPPQEADALEGQIQEAHDRMEQMGHPIPERAPLADEESRAVSRMGLAGAISFFRKRIKEIIT